MIKEAIRRTEATFENSGYWIHDHPKRVILMMLLVVVFLAFQLPSIQFDTSTESFFEKDDPRSFFRNPQYHARENRFSLRTSQPFWAAFGDVESIRFRSTVTISPLDCDRL